MSNVCLSFALVLLQIHLEITYNVEDGLYGLCTIHPLAAQSLHANLGSWRVEDVGVLVRSTTCRRLAEYSKMKLVSLPTMYVEKTSNHLFHEHST